MKLVLDYRPTAERPADRIERERLEQLAACFQMFVGHELPNALVPVQGFARMLGEQGDRLDEEGRMLLDRLAALARKADLCSRRLAEIGRLMCEPAGGPAVEVGDVVGEAAAEVNARRGEGLAVRVGGELPAVGVARALLHAVLVQLFANAAQARAGDRECAVEVSAAEEPDGVWLRVRDEGRGMSEPQVAWLTEPFASSRQPGAGGFGLGFFLVRQAAARWGGAVNVTTEPGRGTTVSLFLPAAPRDARP